MWEISFSKLIASCCAMKEFALQRKGTEHGMINRAYHINGHGTPVFNFKKYDKP